MGDHVETTGAGTVRAAPDLAVLTLGASAEAPDVASALAGCTDAVARAVAALDGVGIGREDRRTTSLSLEPRWRHDRTDGFVATQVLEVRIHDVTAVGDVVRAVSEPLGDAFRLHDLAWTLTDSSGPRRRARDLAWADAHDKAQQLAGLSGRTLGEVVRVREAPLGGPGPRMWVEQAKLASDVGMSSEPGESDVSASLVVRWRLVDA